jgi:hypothetical protein
LSTDNELYIFYFVYGLAVFNGILSYKNLNAYFRILFYQTVFALIALVIFQLHLLYFKENKFPVSNHWLMNIQLLVEMQFIFLAVWKLNREVWFRRLILLSNGLFLTTFFIQIQYQGFLIYVNFADVLVCLCFTLLFTIILYQLIIVKRESIWNSPEKIASLGLLIYFACSVPIMSMDLYLIKNLPEIAGLLYHNVNIFLASIRYLFLARALYVIYKRSKQEVVPPR